MQCTSIYYISFYIALFHIKTNNQNGQTKLFFETFENVCTKSMNFAYNLPWSIIPLGPENPNFCGTVIFYEISEGTLSHVINEY